MCVSQHILLLVSSRPQIMKGWTFWSSFEQPFVTVAHQFDGGKQAEMKIHPYHKQITIHQHSERLHASRNKSFECKFSFLFPLDGEFKRFRHQLLRRRNGPRSSQPSSICQWCLRIIYIGYIGMLW